MTTVVIATINPLVGNTGVQTHTRALHEGLVDAGIKATIVTPFDRSARWLPVFAVRKLIDPFNRTWSTRWYRYWHAAALRDALIRHLTHHPADAVLAQCPVSAGVAMDVREEFNGHFPVVMACHFNFSEASEYREKGELDDDITYQQVLEFEKQVLGTVDHVVYVSHWARRTVQEDRSIKVRGSSIIWNGIAGNATVQPIPRSEIGLAADDLLLMNVGTLEKRKNQVGLVDLFAEIVKEWPKARLVLVGDGPDRAEILQRIEKHQLSSKVRLLGTRRDVPALLASADLYIHYSTLENCPLVLIEAARAGLPLAGIAAGGTAELIDALGGFAIDAGSSAKSLDVLRPLLSNSTIREQAARKSRIAFERAFTREAMVAAYMKALLPPTHAPREVAA